MKNDEMFQDWSARFTSCKIFFFLIYLLRHEGSKNSTDSYRIFWTSKAVHDFCKAFLTHYSQIIWYSSHRQQVYLTKGFKFHYLKVHQPQLFWKFPLRNFSSPLILHLKFQLHLTTTFFFFFIFHDFHLIDKIQCRSMWVYVNPCIYPHATSQSSFEKFSLCSLSKTKSFNTKIIFKNLFLKFSRLEAGKILKTSYL